MLAFEYSLSDVSLAPEGLLRVRCHVLNYKLNVNSSGKHESFSAVSAMDEKATFIRVELSLLKVWFMAFK